MVLDWVELAGYVASAFVFLTFWVKTLIPLRLLAIVSNVAFILYALGADLLPVLLLHCALLPLNIIRTCEQIRIYRKVRATTLSAMHFSALTPFMTPTRIKAGHALFRRGDTADRIYVISAGEINLPELGKTLGPGDILGEMGLFAPDRRRCASAICASDCDILEISDRDLIRHCMSEPAFGLFLTRIMVGRFSENALQRA